MLWPEDRSVFFQPISGNIGPSGYATTIEDLLHRALIQSDNAANDKLMGEAGGATAVMATLREKGIEGVRLGADERRMQAQTAGLVWTPALGESGAFETARAHLPREVRDAAMQAYLENPLDGATPIGTVQALAAIKRGEVLSPASTEFLLETMSKARTGPRRLKGGLAPGWTIAHKTGTGQDYRGASVGINDVGLLSAPDGRTYAVAVFLRQTHQATPARLALMPPTSPRRGWPSPAPLSVPCSGPLPSPATCSSSILASASLHGVWMPLRRSRELSLPRKELGSVR